MAQVGMLGTQSLFAAPAKAQRADQRPDADSSVRKLGEVDASRLGAEDPNPQRLKADVPEEREGAERVVQKVREQLNASPMDLKIVVDDGYYVFELVDTKTGDVIRRIPPNWFKVDGPYSKGSQSGELVPAGVLVDQNG